MRNAKPSKESTALSTSRRGKGRPVGQKQEPRGAERSRRGSRPGSENRSLHRSPRGDEFEVIGRAGPVQLERAPYIPAEAREELLVVKHGNTFLCARPDGDIHHARVTGEGLYADDTRYLSELRLKLGGTAPVALSYTSESGYRAVVEATNATLGRAGEPNVPQQTLSLQRVLLISGRLYHVARVRSFARRPIATSLDVSLGADFADVFEVRGGPLRAARGHALAPKRTNHGLSLAYVGEDEGFRETLVEFDPEPATITLDGECADGPQGVSLETVLVEDRPAEALLRVAKSRDASEVVVGAHSCGHAWNSIGSVSAELIQTADLPLRLVGMSRSLSPRTIRSSAREGSARGRDPRFVRMPNERGRCRIVDIVRTRPKEVRCQSQR